MVAYFFGPPCIYFSRGFRKIAERVFTLHSAAGFTEKKGPQVIHQLRTVRRQVPTLMFHVAYCCTRSFPIGLTATVSCLDYVLTSSSISNLFGTLQIG